MHKYRSHNCGELNIKDVGKQVKLSGWVHRRRDHGGLAFIDLRDHFGLTQCVIDSNRPLSKLASVRGFEGDSERRTAVYNEVHEDLSTESTHKSPTEVEFGKRSNEDLTHKIAHLHYESVITITGNVVKRAEEARNKDMATGDIEVHIETFHLESDAEMLPIQVNSDKEFPEDTRLKYRFLDLRREKLHKNIVLRSQIISSIRKKMVEQGFVEFQTPILTASSPEGARDFLVPSRLHPGKFYALPQAPQQFKQLLMTSGFDKYFQIAPCFRDEDARADRSPGEFYQLDIEMSFVTQEDVFAAVEPVMRSVFTEFSNKIVTPSPFPHIAYNDAMLKYGCDKPDLRNPIVISDVTEIFRDSEFTIFRENIKKGSIVRAIPAPKTAQLPRSFFDKMITFAQENGAAGLGYISFNDDGSSKGPIAKFLNEEQLSELKKIAGLRNGDSVFFSSDVPNKAIKLAGQVRIKLGEELNLIDHNKFEFCWVVDFPFYEWNEEENKIDFSHNPFSMPQGGLEALKNANTKEELLAIKAFQYDIVCNGIELSSGAIRNHKPEIMYKAFEIVGYGKEVVEDRFRSLITAFKYGAPPHGGVAPGIDRIVMLIADEKNIREVIAFPMNQQAQDLLMNAPAAVDEKQLKELNIQHRKLSS